ncbi:hypothetical protein C5167_035533 [Papaver somniferum]|uniref:Uncharacterized protein n=1 Tax=Papaver somniferum TaxID=3469 RepID=A0A4Y7KHM1_PAPSO|nr:hypothetical protein C5167_035533 [Papaver somniferum]
MLNSKILIDGGADSLVATSLLEAINVDPSSTSDLSNNSSPSIEPAMDLTTPARSTSDASKNGGLSIQPAVVDSPTPAPVSSFAATTSLGIGGTKVSIGHAAFGNVETQNKDDVDKRMDEIDDKTENMKQVQGALSNPTGAAAHFDELVIFVGCRMNCNLNSRSWKELSWRNNFYNLQPKVRFKSRLKRIALLLASLGVKLGSLCCEKNHLLIIHRGPHFHVLLRLSSDLLISSCS